MGLYAVSCLAITVAASTGRAEPLLDLVRSLPGGDLAGHFLLVGGLAFVSVLAWVGPNDGRRQRRWILVVAGVLAAVTFDELLQAVLPRRAFSLTDLAANVLAVLIFSAFALAARRATRGTT